MAGRKKKTTHSSGLYRKRITVGHNPDGSPIIVSVYGHTIEERDQKIAQIRIDRGLGLAITDRKSTWKFWSDAWAVRKKPEVRPATWGNYASALTHLSYFDPYKISDITDTDMEIFISKKLEEGYSRRILSLLLNIAKQIFRMARKAHAVAIDPTEDVKIPQKAKATKVKSIKPHEEELLWNVKPLPANNRTEQERGKKLPLIRMFALMQLDCGPRREEVVPLEWDDIDFDNARVYFNKAYSFRDKEMKDTKSESGNRYSIISDRYLAELKAWKQINKGTFAGRKWVFPYKNGLITEGQFNDLWDILLDAINGITLSQRIKAGIAYRKAHMEEASGKRKRRFKMYRTYEFTSHQLRHTFATNCLAENIDLRTLQFFMGHSTAEMTMKYVDVSAAALDDARVKHNENSTASKTG